MIFVTHLLHCCPFKNFFIFALRVAEDNMSATELCDDDTSPTRRPR